MFWFFGHPEVYILILPAFGMISEIIPVFSRKVLFGYEFMAAATAAIAFISLGVWAHHMFTVGMSRPQNMFFVVSTLAGVDSDRDQVLQLAGDDVRRPDFVRLADAVRLRLSFDVFDRRLDGHHAGRRAVRFSAQRQLFRRRAFSLGADRRHAVRHVRRDSLLVSQGDGPNAFGDGWPAGNFGCCYVGFIVTFGPMHVSGMLGMPRRIYTYDADRGWDIWNQIVDDRGGNPGAKLRDLCRQSCLVVL